MSILITIYVLSVVICAILGYWLVMRGKHTDDFALITYEHLIKFSLVSLVPVFNTLLVIAIAYVYLSVTEFFDRKIFKDKQ